MPNIVNLGVQRVRARVGTDVRVVNAGDVPVRWEAAVPAALDPCSRPSTVATTVRTASEAAATTARPSGLGISLHPNHGALLPGEATNLMVRPPPGVALSCCVHCVCVIVCFCVGR